MTTAKKTVGKKTNEPKAKESPKPLEMRVRITLLEGMLGTKSGNRELLETYIAGKHPEAVQSDEMDTMPDIAGEIERGTTFFNRMPDDPNVPAIFDYMVKGAFKDAQGCLSRIPGEAYKMKAYKKVIDGLIFVKPRMIPIIMPEGSEITICERPLRAQTMQGERVSLARSEEIPAGSTMEFSIVLFDPSLKKYVLEWLEYGQWRGLGQWRNSGRGIYSYEVLA